MSVELASWTVTRVARLPMGLQGAGTEKDFVTPKVGPCKNRSERRLGSIGVNLTDL
jgi:hypothetical protein